MGEPEAKRLEMAKVLSRWRASGKPAGVFAREAGISDSHLWYWKRRIGDAEAASVVPARIVLKEAPAAPACFELILGDGRRPPIPPTLTGRPLWRRLSALRTC